MLTEGEYQRILQLAEPHIANLDFIAKLFTENPEGGILYSHLSYNRNEKYVTKQKNLMYLARKCNSIMEIGFNIGHSALLMLLSNPNCKIVCFDNCMHSYTLHCFKYLSLTFPKRILMVVGNSNETLENYHYNYFDMAHVDGSHEYNTALKDLLISCSKVKPKGYIIFDDTDLPPMRSIWNYFIEKNKIIEQTLIPTEFHKIGTINVPEMKIAVCSLALGDDYIKKVKYGILRKRVYCNLKNYDFFEDQDIYDSTRPCAWSKINLISRYLSNNKYDYIVWIDADTHIMNINTRLEELINKYQNDKDILLTHDYGNKINSGVMFIKNTLWSREFFRKLYDKIDFLHSANWEQDAMIDMIQKNEFNCREHFEILPPEKQHIFNAYHCNYQYGDFIVHLAGCYRYDKNNGLDVMMNTFCPMKMEEETQETFLKRLQFLKTFRPPREIEI